MNRHQLDDFRTRHKLSPAAAAMALDLTGNRPDPDAWRAFAATLLQAAGLGAIGAGIIFFVAANWQDYGVFGRFALLQFALLSCIGTSMWRPPPSAIGQAALLLATLLTGGLLALFGQSYQTGADVHELFFTWAMLALPFAIAGLSGAVWAVWWGVLNIGLALLCGWLGPDHFFWRFVFGWGLDRSSLLMLPCIVNLLAAGLFFALRGTRMRVAAPLWLVRFLASIGILYGTVATMVVASRGWQPDDAVGSQGLVVALLFAMICTAIGFATWQRKRDVFPMALLAASWIAISTTWVARAMRFDSVGAFFMVAFWLIATSTAAGMLLMHWLRKWRSETPLEVDAEGAAA